MAEASGCAGLQAVDPICRATQAVGAAGTAVGKDVFATIANYFADAARSAITALWRLQDAATSVDLRTPALHADLAATGAIAALVTVAIFLIQVTASALRHDGSGLARAARGIAIAFIGATVAVASTQALLAAVDALSSGVVALTFGTTLSGLGTKLVVAEALGAATNPATLLLMSFVVIAATVVIWFGLMIRKMLIIISAVFAPVAFAGSPGNLSRAWVRRWIELTVALVVSKLVLVVIFMVGLSVLNGAGETASTGAGHAGQSLTNLSIGVLTLLLGGFAPWIAIRVVHFAGEAVQAVHVQREVATAGGRVAVAAPRKIAAAHPAVAAMATRSLPTAAAARSRSAAGPNSPSGARHRAPVTSTARQRPGRGAERPPTRRPPRADGAADGEQTGADRDG